MIVKSFTKFELRSLADFKLRLFRSIIRIIMLPDKVRQIPENTKYNNKNEVTARRYC